MFFKVLVFLVFKNQRRTPLDKVCDLGVTIYGELTLLMDQQHVRNVVRAPSTSFGNFEVYGGPSR